MGGTNLQCRPIVWHGVCCFGLANRGDIPNYSLSVAIYVHGSLDLNNVSMQQSTASYNAAARLASATPPPAHILSRGIGWQVNIIFEPWLLHHFLFWMLFEFKRDRRIILYETGNWHPPQWAIWNRDRLHCLSVCCIEEIHDVQSVSLSRDTYRCEQCRENVGLLGSTRIGSRRVIQISAGFMIFFSMLGELSELNLLEIVSCTDKHRYPES
jgi:hypothetical protein